MVYVVKGKEDFEAQLKSAGDKLVVVDFFATWCGPCKIISPKLTEFAQLFAEKIVVIKVDVDECEDIAMEYNVSSMPTFMFIKNGKQITSFAGANQTKLKETIEANIA